MKTPTKKSATSLPQRTKTKARRAPRPVASRKTAQRKPPHSVRARAPQPVKLAGKKPVKMAAKMTMRKRATAVHKPPVRQATKRGAGPRSGDSDRGLYVRFETPTVKADVAAYAKEKAGMSMNGYIVAATLKAKAEGWKPEMKPEAVADKTEERKTA